MQCKSTTNLAALLSTRRIFLARDGVQYPRIFPINSRINLFLPLLPKKLRTPYSRNLRVPTDDIVIGSPDRTDLQTTIDSLEEYAEENNLLINTDKTVQMVFRKGGRIAAVDKITYKGEELKVVNSFKYLGITLQPTITSFRSHIRERCFAAIRSIYDIENPTRLSLTTAMYLFSNKGLPVLTYG